MTIFLVWLQSGLIDSGLSLPCTAAKKDMKQEARFRTRTYSLLAIQQERTVVFFPPAMNSSHRNCASFRSALSGNRMLGRSPITSNDDCSVLHCEATAVALDLLFLLAVLKIMLQSSPSLITDAISGCQQSESRFLDCSYVLFRHALLYWDSIFLQVECTWR